MREAGQGETYESSATYFVKVAMKNPLLFNL